MKTVNLEEIKGRYERLWELNLPPFDKDNPIIHYDEMLIMAMREACNQAIELAAENINGEITRSVVRQDILNTKSRII